MKNILFLTVIGLALLSFTGCGEEQKPQTPEMKCEAGKCGEGKCGDE